MKTLSFLLLLAFCAGCAKTEFEYGVNCDFPTAAFFEHSWLVVSNNKGDILHTYELGLGQSQLTDQFAWKAKEAEDTYNLHWVTVTNGEFNTYTEVWSQFGVRNGAEVVFQPEYAYGFPYEEPAGFQLTVTGLPAFDSLDIPGIMVNPFFGGIEPPSEDFSYDPATQILNIHCRHSADCFRSAQQGLVLRVRSEATADFHSIYLSETALLADSVTIGWPELIPESNFHQIGLPDGGTPSLSVTAVEADFRHFVTLASRVNGNTAQFNSQNGLNPNALLRVSMVQVDQNGYYLQDKIFEAGTPLNMEAADFRVNNAGLLPSGILEIATEGDIDLVEAGFLISKLNDGSSDGAWYVRGEATALQHAVLPDLSSILPDWVSSSHARPGLYVNAYQYDQLNFGQLSEGYPYKGNGKKFFPEARYGLKKISSTF